MSDLVPAAVAVVVDDDGPLSPFPPPRPPTPPPGLDTAGCTGKGAVSQIVSGPVAAGAGSDAAGAACAGEPAPVGVGMLVEVVATGLGKYLKSGMGGG